MPRIDATYGIQNVSATMSLGTTTITLNAPADFQEVPDDRTMMVACGQGLGAEMRNDRETVRATFAKSGGETAGHFDQIVLERYGSGVPDINIDISLTVFNAADVDAYEQIVYTFDGATPDEDISLTDPGFTAASRIFFLMPHEQYFNNIPNGVHAIWSIKNATTLNVLQSGSIDGRMVVTLHVFQFAAGLAVSQNWEGVIPYGSVSHVDIPVSAVDVGKTIISRFFPGVVSGSTSIWRSLCLAYMQDGSNVRLDQSYSASNDPELKLGGVLCEFPTGVRVENDQLVCADTVASVDSSFAAMVGARSQTYVSDAFCSGQSVRNANNLPWNSEQRAFSHALLAGFNGVRSTRSLGSVEVTVESWAIEWAADGAPPDPAVVKSLQGPNVGADAFNGTLQ